MRRSLKVTEVRMSSGSSGVLRIRWVALWLLGWRGNETMFGGGVSGRDGEKERSRRLLLEG